MIKQLILVGLITFSIQVQNCENNAEVCKVCSDGYTLIKDDYNNAKCIKTTEYDKYKQITENCIEGNAQYSECTSCARGFILSERKCKNAPHCSNFVGESCYECRKPFAYNDGKCEKRLLCEKVLENMCIECIDYYYPDNGGCKRIPINNCKSGNSTECFTCEDAYYIDNNKKCTKIPDECTNFDKPNKACRDCISTYYVKDGKCVNIPIANCAVGNAETCTTCVTGYYLDNNQCLQIPAHCSTFNYQTKLCTACESTYYVKDGKCENIPIANCAVGNAETCTTCQTGYDISEDKRKCTKPCKEPLEICAKCKTGFESFDYGETCTELDPKNEEPKKEDRGGIINLNFGIAAFVLSLIL